jgi:hypothetical protein
MKFTFGIPTNGMNVERLFKIINSIRKQNIPEYEIIIIGGKNYYKNFNEVVFLEFDENIKQKWITRKKNLIAQAARYDNIVIAHDYYEFLDDWYNGYVKFGEDWDVCQNICLDIDDKRYYDWVAWDHPKYRRYDLVEDLNDNQHLYVPGHYFLVKKQIIEKIPLDEKLVWGESEDIEWTYRLRQNKFLYKMNPYSKVKHLKEYRGYKK